MSSEVEFTERALRCMRQRGILREQVEHLIAHPQNRFQGYAGRTVCESIVRGPGGKPHLLRAVVDYAEDPPIVVTVLLEEDVSRYGGR